jgi:hypothetical protein
MGNRLCLAVLLFTSAAFAQNEGDLVSRAELVREIPADKTHPTARKVISVDEGEISCKPSPKRVLVVHHRAEPTSQFSLNDDRIDIALEQGGKFRILKVLESETVIVDGILNSDVDFEEVEFVTLGGIHFLYVRTEFAGSGHGASDDVYAISSDDRLSIIPFEDVSKSKLLRVGEDLRNGGYQLEQSAFTFESGVYKSEDGECCPSDGAFHAQFRLAGEFKEDTTKHVFNPDFKFVIVKEWRSKDF